LWYVTLFHWVSISWCFEGLQCLHLQVSRLKMKAPQSFKMLGIIRPKTQWHIPGDLNHQT
jgi:hypothetical protein